jgi:hypothetical protein
MYSRKIGDRQYSTSVPMAKPQIPIGTLKHILELAGVTVDEFCNALR